MNTITVTAHGAPGSFVRRVQEDPEVAIALKIALEEIAKGEVGPEQHAFADAHRRLVQIAREALKEANP